MSAVDKIEHTGRFARSRARARTRVGGTLNAGQT